MLNGIFSFHLLFLVTLLISTMEALNDEFVENGKNTHKLSRKRRYLIFPTGSSAQLGK